MRKNLERKLRNLAIVDKVSIVIVTYNRGKLLDRLLGSLRYLNYPSFEVIVVNGPSDDSTEEVLAKYQQWIRIFNSLKRNVAVSRNIGLAAAAGKYVAFIDDDAVPEPEWLDVLVSGFSDEEIAAVGSDVYDSSGVNFQARKIVNNRYGEALSRTTSYDIPYSERFNGVIGVNNIFRLSAVIKVGGFNEQYDYYLDETELCARLVDAGFKINYLPGAFVYHKFAPSYHRDERKATLDYSSIIKNTVYYVNTYQTITGAINAKKFLDYEIRKHSLDAIKLLEYQAITIEECISCLSSIVKGAQQGAKDYARKKQLLITPETLHQYQGKFKQFFPKLTFEEKLTIVYLLDYHPSVSQNNSDQLLYEMAKRAADYGHQVHIIVKSNDGDNSVEFEEVLWVHRIATGLTDLASKILNWQLNFPGVKDRLSEAYAYYSELLNISNKRKVALVRTSSNHGLAGFSLLSKEFLHLVTLVGGSEIVDSNNQAIVLDHELSKIMIRNADYLQLTAGEKIDFSVSKEWLKDELVGAYKLGDDDFSKSGDYLCLGVPRSDQELSLLIELVKKVVQNNPRAFFNLVVNEPTYADRDTDCFRQQLVRTFNNEKYSTKVAIKTLNSFDLDNLHDSRTIFIIASGGSELINRLAGVKNSIMWFGKINEICQIAIDNNFDLLVKLHRIKNLFLGGLNTDFNRTVCSVGSAEKNKGSVKLESNLLRYKLIVNAVKNG